MRGYLKVFLSLVLLFLALHGLQPQESLLGDLLTQGWQAELQNDIGKASSNYARAISLRPEDPLLRIKYAEMLILLDRPDEVARQLVQALELLSKDPKAPVDLKRYICDLLMGRLTAELRERRMRLGYDYEGWLFPSPFATLPVETQKRVLELVPKEWLFPTKAGEAWFRLSIGERERGLKLLREAVVGGEFRAPVHVVMSRFVPEEQRAQVAKNWLRDAENTNNPFLWLAALNLLWRTQQIDDLRKSFPKALQALKDQPTLLVELANLCRQMNWEKGYEQVLASLPPSHKPATTIADIRRAFNQALDEGDLPRVKMLIRILVDFPDQFRSIVLGSNSIRKMLGHRWHDLVVELIQLDLVPELPYDTKQVLLRDAAFNPSLFSHWMRLFMSKPIRTPTETALNLLETTTSEVNEPEPERAIWMLEQGLLIFPDEPRLLKPLALAYEQAGYFDRAIEILRGMVKRSAKAGVIDSDSLYRLWDIAFRYRKLQELVEWLEGQSEDLPLGYFVVVAQLWMKHNKPQEALKWLDKAYETANRRGWLKDAEIHALAYHLVQSPNPKEVEEGQKLRAKVARTNLLFHPNTYELRLNCLLRLGKPDEARKVLEEAQKLYPNYPFKRRVQGLVQIAVTDWEAELKREIENWQKLGAPSYSALVRLAYATVKAGKTEEAEQIADKLMAGQPQWREGYLRAVDLFVRRVDAIVPFVHWLYEILPEYRFAAWRRAIEETGNAIRMLGETSLSGAFVIASALLVPANSKEQLFEALDFVEMWANQFWMAMSDEDRERLKSVLQKERINMFVLNKLTSLGYRLDLFSTAEGEAVRKLGETLASSQTKSAHALICQIRMQMPKVDKDRLQQLIAALEKADWSDANWCPLTFGASMPLAKRLTNLGFREEAIRLLKIALKHAPDEHKANLMAQLTELTGKLPEPPKGKSVRDGKAWLLQAQTAWRAGKTEEAKQAALKALELGLSLDDQVESLKILAQIDPELALKQIQQRFPNFLVSQPNTDPPNHLLWLSDVLFQVAENRKDLAPKVLPLLERACEFSELMKVNRFAELALVHFWVGNKLRGITTLFEPLDKGKQQGSLSAVICVMVRDDVPEEVRRQIAQHLSSYLQNRKVSLSLIADELGNARTLNLIGAFNPKTRQMVVNVSFDSLTELARILKQHLERMKSIVPRKFLEQVLLKVEHFAVVNKPFSQERLLPEEVVEAWWKLFEAAFKKAVKTSGDEKSLKQWLRQFYVERPDTYFSQTIWFERLKKLVE